MLEDRKRPGVLQVIRGGWGGGGGCKGVFYDLQVGRRAADRRLDVPAL